MSCLDVMYHQSYGAHHYLPATSAAAAAAAYKAAYYHHHHQQQQQQQKKFGAYSRMQDSEEFPSHCGQNKQPGALKPRPEPELPPEEEQNAGEEERCKETQPAEAEYLSARCVVFTYFRGDIGDVVDEHFSRALSQPSAFSNDAKTGRLHSGGPWKEGNSHSEGQCGSLSSSLWGSGYPSQSSPCVPSSHPDFPHSAAFHPADTGIWSSHSLAQTGLPPPSALTDSWHYGLGAQSGAGYPHVHEMYPHMHPRHPHSHAHRMLHHAHSPALDPRFSPLLLPGVRASCSPTSCTDGIKTELEPSSIPAPNWPVSFHGSVDIYDTALEQDKAKASVWF
ncbi:transcription cofactor vestigial-like protein 3 isoform X1 [Megalobrama amblycephala]|uniref:transcription cofactor vestigial-like protein 3 isoform X1 n=1 Tax=Megalobrama amblycephala TaxID=75352 RepID=UPI002013E7F1|nr:transcription cofactor vestigial-like protein 3 isoform X1 [Megalobrama amblycephala]